jgi:endonuclease III
MKFYHVENYVSVLPDREVIRALVTTLPHPTRDSSVEWKMTRLYESCMALDTIESDKYTPLRKIINHMGMINYKYIFILTGVYWKHVIISVI